MNTTNSTTTTKVIIPIPLTDFDPTEVAIPWKILKGSGIEVSFATPNGNRGKADPIMVTGKGLGPLKNTMRANNDARLAYEELEQDDFFLAPLKYSDLNQKDFQGLVLPGGHAGGMKEYLESSILQNFVTHFFESGKPVGAICHGVVLLARCLSEKTSLSVLHGRKTTALPNWMEYLAWYSTRLWMGSYYRTYIATTVQNEVSAVLESKKDFLIGSYSLQRDSTQKQNKAFVVEDKNYISARWPGDAHLFAKTLVTKLLNNKS